MISTLAGRHTLEAPYLLRQQEEEEVHTQRRPIRRLLLKLSVALLIILLLIGVAWVIPVASGALWAQPEIAPSFVAGQSLV